MTIEIVIIDYGIGNLLSIERAVYAVGARPVRSRDQNVIANANHLILPGVGAFGYCAKLLKESELLEAIYYQIKSGKPFLGICVGMQLLLSRSSEFGINAGLDLISGSVNRIDNVNNDSKIKVPHIGWNRLYTHKKERWKGTILENLAADPFVYFVHSYVAKTTKEEHILAMVDYENMPLTAAIQKDNITGLQFHPEKSGLVGLEILTAFTQQKY